MKYEKQGEIIQHGATKGKHIYLSSYDTIKHNVYVSSHLLLYECVHFHCYMVASFIISILLRFKQANKRYINNESPQTAPYPSFSCVFVIVSCSHMVEPLNFPSNQSGNNAENLEKKTMKIGKRISGVINMGTPLPDITTTQRS